MKNFWLKIKKFFLRLLLINDTPHKVAAGFALGIFLGITPGEGFISTVILSSLFRLNRLSATAGVLATNMWSTFVVLPLAAGVGAFLFGKSQQSLLLEFHLSFDQIGFKVFFSKPAFFNLALPLLVGFLLVAVSISLLAYFLIRYLLYSQKIDFSHGKYAEFIKK